MSKNKLLFCFFLLVLPIVCLALTTSYILTSGLDYICLIVCVLSMISSILSLIFLLKHKISLSRLFFVITFVSTMVLIVWYILKSYDLLTAFSSVESFKQFILSTKSKGMIIYVLIQFIQVLFIPIPSMIITLTGVAIYGPWLGSLLCIIGVLLGSYVSFFAGKILGFRIFEWIANEKNARKYSDIINKKGKFFLIIAFLLPLFPDDVLCLIAGITSMKFRDFFWIALTTRPIGVICMSFFGGGYIIPFSGWGLFVWPFILVIAVVSVILCTKYQDKIEYWIVNKVLRIKVKQNKI